MIDLAWPIGPHLMQGFAGTKAGDAGVEELRAKAESGDIGGAILFDYNVESPNQVRALTRYIATWQVPAENLPLLVAIDQEGGNVQRLSAAKGFHGWPSATEVGSAAADIAQATLAGLPVELADLGINVNFAPVVDVAKNAGSIIGRRGRSFGANGQAVTALAAQSLAEHSRNKVVAAIKHFPGLGACTGDTHDDLIDGTSTWSRAELLPYESLIASSGLRAIMSTHMVHTEFEPSGTPLTFSRLVMQGLLRDEMGFDGVLFTDDLGMGSIVRHYDLETTVVESLRSGHDILVFGQNAAASSPGSPAAHSPIAGLSNKATAAVNRALQAGHLSPGDLEASGRRLHKLRASLCSESARPRF